MLELVIGCDVGYQFWTTNQSMKGKKMEVLKFVLIYCGLIVLFMASWFTLDQIEENRRLKRRNKIDSEFDEFVKYLNSIENPTKEKKEDDNY